MNLQELLAEKRAAILETAARHGARNVRVFGSVARGEADDKSDVDLLVKLDPERSLIDLNGLAIDIEKLLGRDVDVVSEAGLKPRMRDRVLGEAKPL